MLHLDTQTLAIFAAVVEAGSFTAAAQRIGKTQSAVSVSIARFEDRIGRKLFDRSRRGIHLTPTGTELLEVARRMLAIEQDALSRLFEDRYQGRIRIGMPDDYLGMFGSVLMSEFAPAHPAIQLEIFSDFSRELEKLIEIGAIDIAIVTRDPLKPIGQLLRSEQLAWWTSRDKGQETQRPLPVALFPEGCRARPHIIRGLQEQGIDWRIAWSSSHLASILMAINLGVAVSALPTAVTNNDLQVIEEGILPALPAVDLAILWADEPRAAVRHTIQFLRERFAESK